MWFKKLVGFDEVSPENVRESIIIDGKKLISKVNGQSFQFGVLEIPTLEALKEHAPSIAIFKSKITVAEIVGNVQQLHCEPDNSNALFQAASQFNLLEMIGPHISPEKGIDIYEQDHTQGPACAIACGAGTIYRNYFVPLNHQIGQSDNHQIDCLDLIGKELNNTELLLWEMRNGYALLNQNGLLHINAQLGKLNHDDRENLKGKLKIGIQWDTQVTLIEKPHLVSQAYCSALPVAYSEIESIYWEAFARLILEATYEATFYAALLNLEKTGSNKLYLTLVGGGAFGNEPAWIMDALLNTIRKFKTTPLAVKVISYGSSNPLVQKLIHEI